MLITPALVLLAAFIGIVSGADWCYQSQVACNHTCTGPDVWGLVSQDCRGKSQSPVNVVTKKAERDPHLTPIEFSGHQETFNGRLTNTDHNVKLDLPPGIRISGGGLSTTYKALQLHFHWGNDGGPGSEHTIDGERFPMEMHIVTIKEEYESLSEATEDETGVAALGFFFQESKSANKKFNVLVDALKRITQPTNSTVLQGVSVETFLPPKENRTRFYRYEGSLTTPGCAEAVVWTLFEQTIPLSRQQLSAFCQLQFSDGKPMVNVHRPLQPFNQRRMFYSEGHVALSNSVLLFITAASVFV